MSSKLRVTGPERRCKPLSTSAPRPCASAMRTRTSRSLRRALTSITHRHLPVIDSGEPGRLPALASRASDVAPHPPASLAPCHFRSRAISRVGRPEISQPDLSFTQMSMWKHGFGQPKPPFAVTKQRGTDS